jgi:bacterial/archaeal transporter family protein
MPILAPWFPWAVLSAVFAALTTIFAKVGLEGIDSDYATLLRTVVIVLTLGALIHTTGKWQSPWNLPSKSVAFLVLSAFGDRGVVALLFPGAQARPCIAGRAVDKLSVVLVALFAVAFLGERPVGREWAGIALVGPGVLLLSFRH